MFQNETRQTRHMATRRLVLLVYADPADRTSTVLLLESAGYQVASAGNFEEAKQLLAREAPDVLITDLRLGPYNGLHLVLRSRTDHPDMAALVTSHFPDPVLQAEAERGQARFLVRPIADDDLLEAISTSIGTPPFARAQVAPAATDLLKPRDLC
jgi:CheY-like chemotaxis protein